MLDIIRHIEMHQPHSTITYLLVAVTALNLILTGQVNSLTDSVVIFQQLPVTAVCSAARSLASGVRLECANYCATSETCLSFSYTGRNCDMFINKNCSSMGSTELFVRL